MTLITTRGSASANSFVTIDEAAAYLALSPYDVSDWSLLSTPQKELRLTLAASVMGYLTWGKFKIYRDQALCFPRWEMRGRNRGMWNVCDTYPIDECPYIEPGDWGDDQSLISRAANISVPDAIMKAQAWIAWDVVHRGLAEAAFYPATEGKAYKDIGSLSLGGAISVSMSQSQQDTGRDPTQLVHMVGPTNFAVYGLLHPFISQVSAVSGGLRLRLLPKIP